MLSDAEPNARDTPKSEWYIYEQQNATKNVVVHIYSKAFYFLSTKACQYFCDLKIWKSTNSITIKCPSVINLIIITRYPPSSEYRLPRFPQNKGLIKSCHNFKGLLVQRPATVAN